MASSLERTLRPWVAVVSRLPVRAVEASAQAAPPASLTWGAAPLFTGDAVPLEAEENGGGGYVFERESPPYVLEQYDSQQTELTYNAHTVAASTQRTFYGPDILRENYNQLKAVSDWRRQVGIHAANYSHAGEVFDEITQEWRPPEVFFRFNLEAPEGFGP